MSPASHHRPEEKVAHNSPLLRRVTAPFSNRTVVDNFQEDHAASRRLDPGFTHRFCGGGYYWKQWKQPRTRRRNLLALGADPATVHMATRSRKGYWRMSQNEIVRFALNNRWLEEQGVPDMNAPAALAALDKPRSHFAWTQRSGVKAVWIVLHYGSKARV